MRIFAVFGNVFKQIGEIISSDGKGRLRIFVYNLFIVLVFSIIAVAGIMLAKADNASLASMIFGYTVCGLFGFVATVYSVMLLILFFILIFILRSDTDRPWTLLAILLDVTSLIIFVVSIFIALKY